MGLRVSRARGKVHEKKLMNQETGAEGKEKRILGTGNCTLVSQVEADSVEARRRQRMLK